MTADEVRTLLRTACEKAGSQRAFARAHDLSAAYVGDVLLGKREPADAICAALGLERKTTYTVIFKRKRAA